MIEEIIKREWRMFGQVQNEGGPASCQEDYETFEIMRRSQFYVWNETLRESYLNDLKEAEKSGRNLLMEKYAWMMESTAKEQFEGFRDLLPQVTPAAARIIEEIISIQVTWRETFAGSWPHLSGQARLIHTAEDQGDDTSFETYLRGELKSYSAQTLLLYGRLVAEFAASDRNMTEEIMKHTVRAYGYESLEQAEAIFFIKV